MKELLQQTLRYAKIENDSEPQKDSLHDRFTALLKDRDIDFKALASMSQSSSEIDRMNADTEVSKFIQQFTKLGSTLDILKFGGYR